LETLSAAPANGRSNFRDIARSAQGMYEEAFFNEPQSRTGFTNFALAGGCAVNSVATRSAASRTFRRL
jgi:predicted NodU family carbamoyl transferase